MCLYCIDGERKIADHGIECWKVLVKYRSRLYTAFMHARIPLLVKIGIVCFRPKRDNENQVYKTGDGSCYINGGYIHVYSTKEMAERACEWLGGPPWRKGKPMDAVVVRCVIPAGTPYYEGNSYDIAAKKVRFVKTLRK